MIRPVTYAIWHVPKTGGKSLQDYFQTSLSDEGAFVHLRTRDHVQAFPTTRFGSLHFFANRRRALFPATIFR